MATHAVPGTTLIVPRRNVIELRQLRRIPDQFSSFTFLVFVGGLFGGDWQMKLGKDRLSVFDGGSDLKLVSKRSPYMRTEYISSHPRQNAPNLSIEPDVVRVALHAIRIDFSRRLTFWAPRASNDDAAPFVRRLLSSPAPRPSR
jgi:hypothetical protein